MPNDNETRARGTQDDPVQERKPPNVRAVRKALEPSLTSEITDALGGFADPPMVLDSFAKNGEIRQRLAELS